MIEVTSTKIFLITVVLALVQYGGSTNVLTIEPAKGVHMESSDSMDTLSMDENNHNFKDRTEIFTVAGATAEPQIQFISTQSFIYELVPREGKYVFYSTQYFDYEQPNQRTYSFNVKQEGIRTVTLNINNIDDESPSLSSLQCTMNENTFFDLDNSTCSCTLRDPDGWLSKSSFTVLAGSWGKEPNIFELGLQVIPPDNIYETDVYLYLKDKYQLDFETIKFYSFKITVKDGAGHPPDDNPNSLAIVNVGDMRDTPPVWTNMIGFERFQEQKEQNFSVSASDGDVGLNKPINYIMVSQDDEEAKFVSIDKEKGTIIVSPIDRDKNDITTYEFTIAAFVADEPEWITTNNVTFYILDIDNNPPVIEYIIDRDETKIDFDKDKEKSMSISFLENYGGSLNTTVFIRDIDLGDNAQFKVQLETPENSKIDQTVAFMVVPNIGLRTSTFQINVLDATYLDYEKEGWKDIHFNVLTTGTLDPTKMDRMSVNIELIDYNDEAPKFDKDEYTVTIKETAPKDQKIIQVLATDLDAEDKILKHTLVGSTHVLDILRIESDTGIIFVKSDNAFDYDTLNPVFVQVTAIDKVGHSATVPVTINLEDVNNKAPTISSGSPISIEENQKKGTILKSTITASDVDTTANLTVEINWDQSYALKNSRQIDKENNGIWSQVKFLDVDSPNMYSRNIEIILNVNGATDKIPAPDYETFDSLYISLTVTDLNTDRAFLDKKSTSEIILIGIIDINDNKPIFDDPKLYNRTVEERAGAKTAVGFIRATDLDVNDVVKYKCSPENPPYDWLALDEDNGTFTVKTDDQIDADTDKIFTFNYTCAATDGFWFAEQNITVEFYILDRNNKVPVIEDIEEIHLIEKPDDNSEVMSINTTDADRDIPFHSVDCRFSVTSSCYSKFYILNNVVKVTRGSEIDRDEKEKSFTCSIDCEDNQIRWRSEGVNSNSTTFTIIVDDKNDHTPELDMKDIVTSESIKKDELIIMLVGKDIDEGKNAEIDFTLTSVINVDDKSNNKDITSNFVIYIDDKDYKKDEQHKQAHLIAKTDLKGLYGKYIFSITLADRGDNPNIKSYTITLTIMKFNFAAPRFISPNVDSFILSSDQQPNGPLAKFRSVDYLEDFHASESSDEDTCQKWDMIFKVTELSPGIDKTYFKFFKVSACTYQLQVTSDFNSDVVLQHKNYMLQITAKINTDDDPLWDQNTPQQPLNSDRNISIIFANNIQKPYFDNPTFALEVQEAKVPQSFELTEKAHYDVGDEDLKPYYFLKTNSDTIKNIFKIDIVSGGITVEQKFYYDLDKEFQFQILTADDARGINDRKDALLSVTVTVLPANYRPPKFNEEYFYGPILPGYVSGTPIITAQATDPDFIDQDNLNYSIPGNIEAFGAGLNNIPKPAFLIEPTTGKINLNFLVETTMSGYFLFDVIVTDKQDQFGNGPHNDTAKVTIFIITNDKKVDFRFYNNVSELQENEKPLLDTMTEVIGIQAYRESFRFESSVDGNLTIASLYFIKTTKSLITNIMYQDEAPVVAVDATVIMRLVSGYGIYSRLQAELRNYKLMLVPFQAAPSEDNGQLKAWLIGTSAVLGALCVVLLIIFIIRIKQLNKTISKLTSKKFGSQESGLNRLGMTAPTTNKHAVEGSNPIFNIDEMKKPKDIADFDTNSIRSGDSDLIGVEDNPEFDLTLDQTDDKTTYL